MSHRKEEKKKPPAIMAWIYILMCADSGREKRAQDREKEKATSYNDIDVYPFDDVVLIEGEEERSRNKIGAKRKQQNLTP